MATVTVFAQDLVQVAAIDGVVARSANLTLVEYVPSIPSGATINGITVTWTGGAAEWDETAAVMSVGYDSTFSAPLRPNNTPVQYPEINTITFGGANNLWGLTWTPTLARAIKTKFVADITGYHDAFQVTIHFTEAVGPSSINVSQGNIIFSQGKITVS